MTFHTEITELLLSRKIKTKDELQRAKIQLCKKYNMNTVPPDSEILACLPLDISEDDRQITFDLLRKKPMRTISGVAIVAAMTSPEPCPHGRCIPCPGGPKNNTPQSYTGYEPAAMRAIYNNFDPYLQVKNRIAQLETIGHVTDKVDLIIMGGTFTARSFEYQYWFVKRCFDALNKTTATNLETAQKKNETGRSRCIGLTVETRPDWFRFHHADHCLHLGATRVELGVQTVFDDVLSVIKRGHTVTDSIHATRIAKDSGFKVCYHMMPGLPGCNAQRDIDAFRMIFNDPRFKPDMIKIYPTLVIKGTELYDLWSLGEYKSLSTQQAVQRIAKIKEKIPRWMRIQRIQRDIPIPHVSSGVKKGNLRQLIERNMSDHGKNCSCIRCREIGHRTLKKPFNPADNQIVLCKQRYEASEGTVVFLSLEDKTQDVIIGYLRLRDIISSHRHELVKEPSMILREVKVLGRELPLGTKTDQGMQHRGYGKKLIKEAERICIEDFDKKKLFVLSGVGVKEYYRKLGFSDDGVYLSKHICH